MGDPTSHRDVGSDSKSGPTEFVSGIDVGGWVFEHGLDIDRAHLVMLVEAGVVSKPAANQIFDALDDIEALGFDGLTPSVDAHVTTEQAVIDRTGEEVGGRLHTARSRNDKFATWVRLAIRSELLKLCEAVLSLRRVLLTRARETADWLCSAYTCLQRAQPTTLGHHLLAYEGVFQRDFERLRDSYSRVNANPLGSAAVAGTGFDIDRDRTTELLGFDRPVRNSMDAVATRDVSIEAVASTANLMTSVSRLCEELVRWSSYEFGFVELDDSFTGTSSIMPQKRNPYAAEIVRSKATTVAGGLQSLLSLMKGLPMAYNQDFQEATRLTRRSLEDANDSTRIVSAAVDTATFNRRELAGSVDGGFACATELADTIVRETGYSFRTAHRVVASVAASASVEDGVDVETVCEAAREITGDDLTLDAEQVENALNPRANVARRDSLGGPGEVGTAIEDGELRLEADMNSHDRRRSGVDTAASGLSDAVRSIRAR